LIGKLYFSVGGEGAIWQYGPLPEIGVASSIYKHGEQLIIPTISTKKVRKVFFHGWLFYPLFSGTGFPSILALTMYQIFPKNPARVYIATPGGFGRGAEGGKNNFDGN